MKKKLSIGLSLTVIFAVAIVTLNSNFEVNTTSESIQELREKHQTYLDNSPFKESQLYSREKRKELGLPPNAYNEQLWDLTMDPSTGRPMPEKLIQLQEELWAERSQALARGVGGESGNPWVDRGPNDQGGRTRGVMFDPNDVGNANSDDDYTRVFAGGVSGGLWVNEDITNPSSSWQLVPGLPANISVTTIISDPNDSDVFYIGSGESFTGPSSSASIGRGVWKSEDGGVTWTNVLGGFEDTTSSGGNTFVNGIFFVNDIVARDNGGNTEIYAAVASSALVEDPSNPINPSSFLGLAEMGLYKSTDEGQNWSRFNITHGDGSFKNPCDIELDVDNNVWFSTTSNAFGNLGGEFYKSTDGVSFTLEGSISGAARTEFEPSPNNANVFFIAANAGGANLYTTTDGFANINPLNEPNDVDNGIPATDYARGQAFYNLPIEMDENGILYVGGIDLFSSVTGGITWTQISKWSNNNNLAGLNVPLVHADQHAIVFRPNSNGNEAVFANDGGVYYSDDVASSNGNASAIQSRNRDYNTIQFYYGAINAVDAGDGDDIAGGTQDNGTQFVVDANPGANPYFINPGGGDGGFTEIDDSGTYAIYTLPGNSSVFANYPGINGLFFLSTLGGGSFINEAELDKNLDILYANASTGGTNRIERVAEFLPGGAAQTNTALTNGLMNARPSALKVSPYTTGATTLFVGLRNGRLLRVNFANLAPAWANITGPGFVGSISDIEFGQSEDEIFVTMFNYGVRSIWATTNGGTDWVNIEGDLPDMPVNCILQNPLIPQELIIGTEFGVWATPDYTATNVEWIQAYNGMSDVTVKDLDLRVSDNVILASTHGRGMFTSQFTADPLSVLDLNKPNNKVAIYPTLVSDFINVTSTENLGKAKLKLFDLNGREIYSRTIELNTNEQRIDVNYGSGIYFVNINAENFSISRKVIVQ